jgi:hypothetical protein
VPNGRNALAVLCAALTVASLATSAASAEETAAPAEEVVAPADEVAATAPPAPPGAPVVVEVTPGNTSAVVRWEAPASDGGAPIQAFVVKPSGESPIRTGGDKTAATVTGLSNGTPLRFTVSAVNTAGTGPASDASAVVTPRTVPGQPSAPSAAARDNAAVVRWDLPRSDGGATIAGFVVTAAPSGRSVRVGAGQTSAVVSRLPNGVPSTFTVAARNEAGTGRHSPASARVVPRGDARFTVLRQPAARVLYGTQSTVRARLVRPDGTGVPRKLVYLQAKRGPDSPWRRVAAAQTGYRGQVALQATLPASAALRLRHPPSTVATHDLRTRPVVVAKRVTASATRLRSRLGMTVAVRGRVAPAQRAGSKVHLQRRASGRWVTVARGRMATQRRYAIRWKPGLVATHTLRVVKAADAARAAGTSAPFAHRVDPESAADVARDILRNGRITLATVHLSAGSDGATPQQNMADVANGRLARRSCYGGAPCGATAMHVPLLRAVRAMGQRGTVTISEFAGGRHAGASAHYSGRAIDITWVNGTHVGYGTGYGWAVDICRAHGANQILTPGNDPWGGHSRHVHCGW